jgi:hypothetical protein
MAASILVVVAVTAFSAFEIRKAGADFAEAYSKQTEVSKLQSSAIEVMKKKMSSASRATSTSELQTITSLVRAGEEREIFLDRMGDDLYRIRLYQALSVAVAICGTLSIIRSWRGWS